MNIRTKLLPVHNKTTKLSILFVLVGAMMIVIPMPIEQVNAKTSAIAVIDSFTHHAVYTNVKGRLDAGRWIQTPTVHGGGSSINWITAGPLPFGGNEKGQVDADVVFASAPDQPIDHVTFFWTNPRSGPNTCNVKVTGDISLVCHISQGDSANAIYRSTVR